MQTEPRRFLSIVGWDDFQYADTRKKPNPPWRWCRLPRVLIDNPDFQSMTMAQRGAFCWLLLLASETGNLIPDDPKFLRNRIQLDARLKLSLINLGLIEEIALPPNSPQVKNLRRIYSGGPPEERRTVEAEEETEKEKEEEEEEKEPGTSIDQSRTDTAPRSPADTHAPLSINRFSLPPPRSRRNGAMLHAGDSVGNGQRPGHDRRSFDELKAAVLPIAQKLNCRDADQLYKLAGQSLRMSPKQCATALKQLIEDGQL